MTHVRKRALFASVCIFSGILAACSQANGNTPDASAGAVAETVDVRANGIGRVEGETYAWRTVFLDDFDGETLDRSKWAPEVSCWGGGNNERQCYTDRTDNVQVSDGYLHLIAQEEEFTGPLYPEGMPGAPGGTATQPYTSGKVRTRGLAAFKYGRVSARLKLPAGQGTWPAFWMMSNTDELGGWPLSGEIDIMEAVNLGTDCEECPGGIERRSSAALHFGKPYPKNEFLFQKISGESVPGPSEEWRVYAVEWGQTAIQWSVDDEVFMRIEHDDWYTASPEAEGRPYAPFDHPFYVMLNFAVGGALSENSNGGGFDPASYPNRLLADWVRVEQCDGDEDTGMACLAETDWAGELLGPEAQADE
jgi:beta-glucanase (GH16 family)